MHRASHYHGRIVISLSTGSMVGRVRRVVADLDQALLGGLLVQPEGGEGTGPVAIPGAEVHSFGEDAIMVRLGPDEISPEQSSHVFELMKREHQVFRTGLYTSGGTKVGYLVEPYYQLDAGVLKPVAYEVFSDVLFADRVRGVLLNGPHITLGRDLILIPDDVTGYLLAEEDDLAMQVRGELGARKSPAASQQPPPGMAVRPPPPPPPSGGARPTSSPGSTNVVRPVPPSTGIVPPKPPPEPEPEPSPPEPEPEPEPPPPPPPEPEPEPPPPPPPEPEPEPPPPPPPEPEPEVAKVPEADAKDFDAESLSDVISNLSDGGEPEPLIKLEESGPGGDPGGGGVDLDSLPEKDQKVVKFVLGKKASRDLEADGAYIVRRGEEITEDVVKQAVVHDMLTLLFLAASDAG